MSKVAVNFYDKISALEREVQKLKTQAFFALPSRSASELYPMKEITRALKRTRDNIWRSRYAKKSARVS